MIVAGVLRMGRRQAEALHTDTFDVLRATGNTVQDPDTLEEVPEYATVHASVMGKLKTGEARPNEVQVPGQTVVESSFFWHTSLSIEGVLPDDVVVCTGAGDPDLVGTRVRVAGPFLKSHATARRFPVEVQS